MAHEPMNSQHKIWTQREFMTGFIELYKNNPCLWKVTSEDYTNRIKKDTAYYELLDFCKTIEPTISIEFVKNKINSVRTSYRKELTKINKSIRAGANENTVYKPKLWYFHLLDFLREHDGLSLSRSANLYIDESLLFNEQIQETSTLDGEDEGQGKVHTSESVQDKYTLQHTLFKPHTLIRNNNDVIGNDQNTTIQTSIHKRSASYLNNDREQDEFDALAVSVSKKLRKMDHLQQLFAENLINKALFLGSMGQLNINSDVQPISSYSNNQSPSASSTT